MLNRMVIILKNILMTSVGENVNKLEPLCITNGNVTADGDGSHEIKRCLLLGRKAMTNLGSIFKNQRHYFVDKGPPRQSYGFPSSHV